MSETNSPWARGSVADAAGAYSPDSARICVIPSAWSRRVLPPEFGPVRIVLLDTLAPSRLHGTGVQSAVSSKGLNIPSIFTVGVVGCVVASGVLAGTMRGKQVARPCCWHRSAKASPAR